MILSAISTWFLYRDLPSVLQSNPFSFLSDRSVDNIIIVLGDFNLPHIEWAVDAVNKRELLRSHIFSNSEAGPGECVVRRWTGSG